MCSPFEPGAPSAYSSTDPVLAVSCQVLIKRFCFRNSIEEAVVDLHAKIKDGSVKLVDGKFPKEAVELFRKYGVEQPHIFEPDKDGKTICKPIRPVTGLDQACTARPSQ